MEGSDSDTLLDAYGEEFQGFDLPVENILLPYQGEDWEFACDNQQSARTLESVNLNREDHVPYSLGELTSFYYNPLLERSELYADQFLESSNNVSMEFERLLRLFEKSTEAVIKHRLDEENKSKVIQRLCQKVFDTKTEQIKAEGYCQDQHKVSTVHQYSLCTFNESVATELRMLIGDAQRFSVEDGSLAWHTKNLSQLQCLQYLSDASANVRYHTKKMATNTDSIKSSLLVKLADESVDVIRQCINTMFKFVRKNDDYEESFSKCLKTWTESLVCLLYELAKDGGYQNLASEEQFILNHVIRSPPTTQSWATRLVQISFPPSIDILNHKHIIDHVIYLLLLTLRAPKGRGQFLRESRSLNKIRGVCDDSSEWVFVEETGDYLKGGGSQWHVLPKESDMVSLYQQVPFEKLLSWIMGLQRDDGGKYSFRENDFNSGKFLYVVASCDVICDILGEGLATLGTPRYKQLVRRIGQTLRNVVILVAEYWRFYKEKIEHCPQTHSNMRLQIEFDEFVKRCVERLLAVSQLGVYQFLADLPFKEVSSKAAETMYVLMNVPAGSRAEVDHLVTTQYSRQEWLDFVQDSDTKLAFEDHLSSMPENEIVYLLATFSNLACSQPQSEEHLINIIATDLYTISFVYTSTRDICCKMGRELLCTLSSIHPFVISTILQHIHDDNEALSLQAYYAVSDLPFHLWQPSNKDLSLLRLWAHNATLPAVYGKLVPTIIKGLNFGKGDDGILFLSHNSHCDVAFLLLEICKLHELGSTQSGGLMKGIDKVSRIAYSMRTSLSLDLNSQDWVWDVLLRLKLNHMHLQGSETLKFTDDPAVSVDFNSNVLLSKLITERLPEACYIAIMMTNIGHSLNVFLQQGIPVFKVLAESTHRNAAVYCLATIVEMFMKGGIDLSINSAFVSAVRSCLVPEQSVISHITSKIVESNIEVLDHLKLLMGLVGESLGHHNSEVVLSYWLKLMLKIPVWWETDALKVILDFLLKCAFNSSTGCSFTAQEIMYSKHHELMQLYNEQPLPKQQNRSVLSSLLNYVGGENPRVVSYLPTLTMNFPYLSFYILLAEERYENEMAIWATMTSLVVSNSVQSSIKKAMSSLKLGHRLHPSQLTIYRWAHLIVLTPENCAILPVICQKFFQRLIYIDKSTGSSVGLKFFKSTSLDMELMRKLKMKFSSLSANLSDNLQSFVRNKLPDLYRTFEVWLDEEKLHDSHLYLPSLPSHYQPELLASVRTQNQVLWSQFVDSGMVEEEIKSTSKFSVDFFSEKFGHSPVLAAEKSISIRISDVLKQFEAPATLDLRSSTEISFPILINEFISFPPEVLYDGIKSDIGSLRSHAQNFSSNVAKLNSLNVNYIDLLPDLYSNEEQRRLVKIQCQSAFSLNHSCAGPAQVQLQFLEKTLNDVVSEHLKQNRMNYRSVLTSISEEAASESFGFTAIHLVSTVQALTEKLSCAAQHHDEKTALMEFGATLFFELANLNSDNGWTYTPARHLLLTSIDLLGQTFIFGQSQQAVPLLEQMLKRPDMAAVLSTHFSPASSCQRVIGGSSLHSEFDTGVFAQMYQRIVTASLLSENCDILFVLITKFDIEGWCTEYNPHEQERLVILESIVTGLKFQCVQSSTPKKDSKADISKSLSVQLSSSAVSDVFITHLSLLLQNSADAVFFEAIRLLLNASKELKLDPKAWMAVVESNILSVGGTSPAIQVSYACVDMCIKHLAVFFDDERKNGKSSLYAKWERYVLALSKLMCSLIMFEIDFNYKMNAAGNVQSVSNHLLVSDRILPLFTPWISVMHCDVSGSADLPWTEQQQVTVSPIIQAMMSLVNQICVMDTWDIPQCVSCLWVFYLENTLTGVNEVAPEYIVSCYQSIIGELSWDGFIPNLTDLDKVVQLCHTNQDCILHYLCHIIPKIDWPNIMSMCKVKDDESISWVGHTGELLSYFLQILLYLCSEESRLKTYHDLESLLLASHAFPWHLVGFEEFELLTNITTDRYDALCSVFIPSHSRLQLSRYAVITLLQTASGIPQRENSTFESLVWKDIDNNQSMIQTTWMKRKSFIRCTGNLIRNTLKTLPPKDSPMLELVTVTVIEHLLESILLIVQYDNTVNETVLMDLLTEFWSSISRFHVTLRDAVTAVVVKFIDTLVTSLCPDHKLSEPSTQVHLVLISNLAASCHVAPDPKVLTAVSEHSFNLSLAQSPHSAVPPNDDGSLSAGLDLTLWTSLRHVLAEYGRLPKAAFLETCLSSDCILSLLAVSQNLLDSAEAAMASEKISLEGLLHMLTEWFPKLSPKPDNEEKVLIFVGFLLKLYCQVEDNERMSPGKEANHEIIVEKLTVLIPIFEEWVVDRVRTGILGSLGIGRASQLSVGFRISIRIVLCHLLCILCRLQPENLELLQKSESNFNVLKKLPTANQIYRGEGQNIESLLSIVQKYAEHDQFLNSLFDKLFSTYFTKHCHFLTLMQ